MNKKTVLISGGTGMIGTALTEWLTSNQYKVIVLTRDPDKSNKKADQPDVTYAYWNVKDQVIDPSAIKAANIIVHLAGAGVVDKPWSDSYKKEIIDSRTQSSALLVKSLKATPNQVETVISASAIGWYGEDENGKAPFVETYPHANNFLGNTCYEWEESIQPMAMMGIRLAILRFGVVLSPKGGALKEFITPLKFRIASVLGDGKQIVSWIHIQDLCRMIQFAIDTPSVNEVYNAVAPFPVTNKKLATTLAKAALGSGYITMHVPEFVLKIMLGERRTEVLKSTTVSSAKIQQAGFEFQFPKIEIALQDLAGKRS